MSEALERLIEAVEVGEWDGSWRGVLDADKMMPPQAFSDAYHGSLDAARAVHNALLPGWRWSKTALGRVRVFQDCGPWHEADAPHPARAWLLAVLRAKLSEAENHPRQETVE